MADGSYHKCAKKTGKVCLASSFCEAASNSGVEGRGWACEGQSQACGSIVDDG